MLLHRIGAAYESLSCTSTKVKILETDRAGADMSLMLPGIEKKFANYTEDDVSNSLAVKFIGPIGINEGVHRLCHQADIEAAAECQRFHRT